MLRRLALAALFTLVAVSFAFAAPLYRLVDLGLLPGGTGSRPFHFGPGSIVVGSTDLPGTFGGHATRWDVSAAGVVTGRTDLQGLAGFDGSAASGMNASEWIVGWSNTADPQPRPVLWRSGNIIDLDRGGDGNANVYAFDVNDAGLICGMITKSGGGGGWDACIWSERAGQPGRFDRSFLPMHPSGNPLLGWTEASQVLENGVVYGRTNLGVGDRASLWLADATHTPVLLEPLANSNQSMPGDINELGDAVGYTMYPFGLDRPTRWSHDAAHTPTVLPIWPGYNAGRADVVSPDGNTVLGGSWLVDVTAFPWPALESRVILWRDGALYDLNEHLDASASGWTVMSTADMSADGWILASAKQAGAERAVLLIPVPSALAVGDVAASGVTLASPWPNPARGEVRLSFTLATAGTARLSIHDAQGRLVARLADGTFAAGRREQVWDGRNRSGAAVGPGLYFASLESNGVSRSARIVRVR